MNQALIDHGADTTIADNDGVTPIQHAHKRGFAEIARMLA
jgi:ankyrin repeat protein